MITNKEEFTVKVTDNLEDFFENNPEGAKRFLEGHRCLEEGGSGVVNYSVQCIISECVNRSFNLFRDILRDDLLGDDEVKDISAGLLIEEFDGILHEIGSFLFDNGSTFCVIKALFYSHTSEVHFASPFYNV